MNPTARIPYCTKRMDKMLECFQENNYVDLMQVIYDFADSDYQASRKGIGRKRMEASMERLCQDRFGSRHAYQLLLSIPPAVIKACISGTVGYEYLNSHSFKSLLYRMDMTHGIYLYTITINSGHEQGNFLNRTQIEQLVEMMKRYKSSVGQPDNDEAIAIESSYKNKNVDTAVTRLHGTRVLIGGHGGRKIDILCKKLLERCNLELDVVGDIPQTQGPCGVGYSKKVLERGGRHISEDLSGSTYTWSLVLGCLKKMGIDVKRICVPILKIWDDSQRELGEILITMLASSLVEDGGFNPTQAGGSNGSKDEHVYGLERREVFIERGIIQNQLRDAQQLLQSRRATISSAMSLLESKPQQALAEKKADLEELEAAVTARGFVIKDGILATKEQLSRVELRQRQLTEELEFSKALNDWMAQNAGS